MKKISEQQIGTLVNYISNSIIPAVDAFKIIQMLQTLPNVESGREAPVTTPAPEVADKEK